MERRQLTAMRMNCRESKRLELATEEEAMTHVVMEEEAVRNQAEVEEQVLLDCI